MQRRGSDGLHGAGGSLDGQRRKGGGHLPQEVQRLRDETPPRRERRHPGTHPGRRLPPPAEGSEDATCAACSPAMRLRNRIESPSIANTAMMNGDRLTAGGHHSTQLASVADASVRPLLHAAILADIDGTLAQLGDGFDICLVGNRMTVAELRSCVIVRCGGPARGAASMRRDRPCGCGRALRIASCMGAVACCDTCCGRLAVLWGR